MIRTFHGYGWYLIFLTLLGLLTAAADGVTIAAIIPIISFLLPGADAGTGGTIVHVMQVIFSLLHISYVFRNMIIFVALLVLGRSFLMALFVLMRGWGNARFFSQEIDATYTALINVRWNFILREKAGHLQNIVLWDTKRASQLLDGIIQFLQSLSGFLIYLAVAIVISPLVTLITVGAGVVLVLALRPFLRKTRVFAEETARIEKDLSQHVGEHVQGFKTVKAAGVGSEALAVARGYLARFREVFARGVLLQSLGSIFIQPFGFLFAIAVFSFSYYSGNFSIAAFAATLYLIQKIFVYLDSTQASFSMVVQYVPYAESILEFKEHAHKAREESVSGEKPFKFEREIVFDSVGLRHEGGTEALKDVSLEIKKGTFVGIIGPSGSGKTSFADLLLRLFSPTSGTISLDGISASEIRMQEWRRSIGYVSQDSFLLHASIRENIRFYDTSISDADIEHAAREAQLYDFVDALPDGLDSVIGDRGITLSGGQRQRISLARSLARRPAILVLDEVTSALDSELEAHIQKVVGALRGKLTLIVVAHRVSTVLGADEIIVFKDGGLAEAGNPADMLADADSYLTRIVALQGKGA